jgi:phage shock protein PspC (stress-responsive transcriptional regulator)
MSNIYVGIVPKDRKNKVLAGVCSGIANHYNIDVRIIRGVFIFSCLFYSLGIIGYIILALIMPDK